MQTLVMGGAAMGPANGMAIYGNFIPAIFPAGAPGIGIMAYTVVV